MTQRQHGTSGQMGTSAGPWTLGLVVLLLTYAAVGGAAGALWLIDLACRLVAGPPPSGPFITEFSVNLLFAPIALVGGVLAIGYFRSDDLERASIGRKRLWAWARGAVVVLVAFLACMAVAAVLTGEFPG